MKYYWKLKLTAASVEEKPALGLAPTVGILDIDPSERRAALLL